jgi:hypothetical protein
MNEAMMILVIGGMGFGGLIVLSLVLSRPRNPNLSCGVVGIGIGLIGICAIIFFVVAGNQIDRASAVNEASKVSSDLGAEVAAAQRMSDAEVRRVMILANANRQNKEGEASLTDARGRAAQAYASATKTIEESYTIRDERDAKKIGYGGIAARDLLGEIGIGGMGLAIVLCLGLPFALGMLVMARVGSRRP